MTPLAQLLEILVLLLLFRGVLGYEFREERRLLGIGLIILAVRCAMLFILPEDYTYLIWRSILFPAAAMPFFLQGKWKINLAAGICMMQMVWVMYTLNLGFWILVVRGDIMRVEPPACYYLGLAECLVALGVLSLILRRKKESIFTHMELLNVWMFVPFFVCIWFLINYRPTYIDAPENWGLIVQGKNDIVSGMIGLLILVMFILICFVKFQQQETKRLLLLSQKCLAEQTEQYSRQSLMDEELRKFRHDYIKHITTLQQIAEGTDMDRVRVYLEQIAGEKIKSKSFFLTNHLVCDAILNRYGDACKKQKMKMSVEGKFPEHLYISEVDLCIILTNGLQNAFEAASLCGERGEIDVKVENRENFVTISIRNSALQKPQRQGDGLATTKDDKRNHGIGTRNMADAARKSGGMVEWNLEEEGYVTTNILIRGKEKEYGGR